MKLGMQVGLDPGHTVLDGGPAPLPKPQFSAHICCGQMAGWIKMPLGMEVGLCPGDFVFDGDPASPSEKGHSPTQFLAHVYCGHGRPSQLLLSSCIHSSCLQLVTAIGRCQLRSSDNFKCSILRIRSRLGDRVLVAVDRCEQS